MRLIFLGPPGAGKGTQAVELARDEGLVHIATGDLFRSAVGAGTPLGQKVAGFLQSGQLVPDEVTIEVMRERLGRPDIGGGFILDGFPRTVPQAEALDDLLARLAMPVDAVMDLRVPEDELVRRISGRRVCRECGVNYNMYSQPPKQEGVCDACGGELSQRQDDREETVRERLKVYRSRTLPLEDYYRKQAKLVEVDGERPPAAVGEDIRAALRARFGGGK